MAAAGPEGAMTLAQRAHDKGFVRSPGWDGRYRGVAAPAGVYTYKLLVTTGQDGQSQVSDFAGSVQLLR